MQQVPPPQGPRGVSHTAQPSNTPEPKMSEKYGIRFDQAMMDRLKDIKGMSEVIIAEVNKVMEHLKSLPSELQPKSPIDEAIDLLNSTHLTHGEVDHLKWCYTRMVEVHGENPNVDYMAKMRKILGIEPIYEWQWKFWEKGVDGYSITPYKTWTEIEDYLKDTECTGVQLDESTKRERV
jgi:hypothetical protein